MKKSLEEIEEKQRKKDVEKFLTGDHLKDAGRLTEKWGKAYK